MSCNCENIESKLSDNEGKLDKVLEIVNDKNHLEEKEK